MFRRSLSCFNAAALRVAPRPTATFGSSAHAAAAAATTTTTTTTVAPPLASLRYISRAVKMTSTSADSVICLESGRHVAVASSALLATQYLEHASTSAGDLKAPITLPSLITHQSQAASKHSFGSITLTEDVVSAPSKGRHPSASVQASICVSGGSATVTGVRDGRVFFNCRGSFAAPQGHQLDLLDGDVVVIATTTAQATSPSCVSEATDDERPSSSSCQLYLDALLNSIASNTTIVAPSKRIAAGSSAAGAKIDVETVAEDLLEVLQGEGGQGARTLLIARIGSAEECGTLQPPATILQGY